MLVKDVVIKFHKEIPFPWSIRKIKKAGLAPIELFLRFGRELSQCSDATSKEAKDALEMLQRMGMLL